jgi:endonuclease/exonuclease/phosphatase family metal-dependent hydrolase
MQASYGYEFKENDPYALIRRKQIKKIAAFISTLALDDDHPIVAMGDFNVNAILHPEHGGESREYLEMIEALTSNGLFNVIDLHREHNGGTHPVTNSGRGIVGKKKSMGGQRLDFVFEIRRNRTRRDRIFHKFPHCAVEMFEVEGEVYTHISDHYASHVVMEFLGRDVYEEKKVNMAVNVPSARKAITVEFAE